MMTESDIKKLIAQGEGYNLEFKQSIASHGSRLGEEICAFANSAGGTVLLGIDDKGEIIGITFDNSQRSHLQNALNTVKPQIHTEQHQVMIDGKLILCLECPSGKNKPYTVSGNIIIRNGPNSEKILDPERMRDFFQENDRLVFDEVPVKSFDPDKNLNYQVFNNFLDAAGISDTLPRELLIKNLQLFAEDERFKNGAVLAFGINPQEFFPQAETRCLLFKGRDKTIILDNKIFGGTLFEQYSESFNYLRQKLNNRYRIETAGPRTEELEIPEVVLREAILNALCHRDYSEKGACIMIEIFDDRVVISNPGGLVTSINRAEFGKRSFSRNPLIFGLFQRARMVEKVGSGISRMNSEMASVDLPLPIYRLEGMFVVTLQRPVDFSIWLQVNRTYLTDIQVQILAIVHVKPAVTVRELAKQFNVTPRTVDRHLAGLRKLELIERMGSDRDGHYKVNYKYL